MAKLLFVSGSLRATSSNTRLMRAIANRIPPVARVCFAEPLDRIPHFNPELDTESPPHGVFDWRAELQSVDGLLICSPEYAHGIPGTLKNALDWVVSSNELQDKPTAVICASPSYLGPTHAYAALCEVLRTMGARVLDDASLSIGAISVKLEGTEIIDPEAEVAIDRAIQAFLEAVESRVG